MLAQTHIVALIVALGRSAPPVADLVDAHATHPLPSELASRVMVRAASSSGQQIVIGAQAPIDVATQVHLQCVARAPAGSGLSPQQAVDPIVAAMHERLMSDTTLPAAGYEIDFAFDWVWDEDELDESIGSVRAIYTLRHRAAHNSLTV
jgi:hypothetical protein